MNNNGFNFSGTNKILKTFKARQKKEIPKDEESDETDLELEGRFKTCYSVIQTKRLQFILPWRDCSFSKCYNFIRSYLLFFYLHNTKWLKLDPYFRFLFYPFSSVIYLSIKFIISNSFIINKEYQHFRRERWVRCDRAEPVPVRL